MDSKKYENELEPIKSWDLEDGEENRYKLQIIKKGKYFNVSITLFWFSERKNAFIPTKRNVFLKIGSWKKLESLLPEVKDKLTGIYHFIFHEFIIKY